MERSSLYRIVLVCSLAGYAWLAWNLLAGTGEHSVSVCMVKEITGIPCPSCGTTRTLIALAHGNITDSLLLNPIGVVLAVGLTFFPPWIALDVLHRRNSFFRFYTSLESIFSQHPWIAFTGAAMVVLNWVWNITKGV